MINDYKNRITICWMTVKLEFDNNNLFAWTDMRKILGRKISEWQSSWVFQDKKSRAMWTWEVLYFINK